MTMGIEYQPLHPPSQQIRLLTLLPVSDTSEHSVSAILHTVSLDDQPAFEALSYTWGYKTDTREININGYAAHITKNLEAALRRLRGPKPRVLWVDALCINQKDNDEKNHQVPLMSQIYTNCQQVIIWLGEGNKYIEALFQWLNSMPYEELTNNKTSSTTTQFRQQSNEIAYLGFTELFNLPYWLRMWTYQEMTLPINSPLCVYGNHSSPLSILQKRDLGDCLRTRCDELLLDSERSVLDRHRRQVPEERLNDHNNHIKSVFKAIFAGASKERNYVWSHLLATAGRASSDPRDRIYALHGLCKDLRDTFPAEYSQYRSPERVLLEATVFLVMHECSFLFALHWFRMRADRFCETALPSWVPDYNEMNREGHKIRRCAKTLGQRSIDCPMPPTRQHDTAVIIGIPGFGVRGLGETISTAVPADLDVCDEVLELKIQGSGSVPSHINGTEVVLLPGIEDKFDKVLEAFSLELSAGQSHLQKEHVAHFFLGDKPTLRIAARYIGPCVNLHTFGEDTKKNVRALLSLLGDMRSSSDSDILDEMFLKFLLACCAWENENLPTLEDLRTGFKRVMAVFSTKAKKETQQEAQQKGQQEPCSPGTDEEVRVVAGILLKAAAALATKSLLGIKGIPGLLGFGVEAFQDGDIVITPVDRHNEGSTPLLLRRVETSGSDAAGEESQNQPAYQNKEGTICYKLVGAAQIWGLSEESELVARLAQRCVEDYFVQ